MANVGTGAQFSPEGAQVQLLPIDPKVAMDATREAYEAFRRDFLVASVVTMVLSNVAWAIATWRLLNRLTDAQEKRVQDQKDGEARAIKLADRMAVHMDRSTEATVLSLSTRRPPGGT